ncbi:MAG: ECF transporter S component [Lachnospiraceae bacterium]|nr:ECF transporter S component [Lachnospiraceae bacterium]
MMKKLTTKNLVIAALFAALTCVMTMSVRIPIPGTQGYIHPGDAVVILCGIFLDPVVAFFAAGIGSALADLLGGYFIYVPITFVIKGLVALCGGLFFRSRAAEVMNQYAVVIICGIFDILIVALGYCFCEIFLYGLAAAISSVPANCVQGVSGLIIAAVLYPVLKAALRQVVSAA